MSLSEIRQDAAEGTAPAADLSRTAVLLAAHGDRGADKSNKSLKRHVEEIAETAVFHSVACGFLNGEPGIEEALNGLLAVPDGASPIEQLLIYPFFMSAGYFTNTVLPKRVLNAKPQVPYAFMEPLGFDAGLLELCETEALAAAAAQGFQPRQSRMLIVGHGSTKSNASKGATECFAAGVAAISAFARIDTCYLEEMPFLDAALDATEQPTVVAGLFAGDGLHAREDVPGALMETGGAQVYTGSLGRSPEIAQMVKRSLEKALRTGRLDWLPPVSG